MKGINRLKILQDAIDRNLHPGQAAELRLNGVLLPYSTFDRLSEVDPVAIVDNKRLGHVLGVARQAQRKLDNNRSLK